MPKDEQETVIQKDRMGKVFHVWSNIPSEVRFYTKMAQAHGSHFTLVSDAIKAEIPRQGSERFPRMPRRNKV